MALPYGDRLALHLGCHHSSMLKRSVYGPCICSVKRISKNIPGHIEATIDNNDILTVHNLHYVNILTETFKYIYSDCVPFPIQKCIRPNRSQRNYIIFMLPKLQLSEHQNNFPYSNYKTWNP